MATRAEYITRNLKTIRELVRMGEVSAKSMNDYKIYTFFCALKNSSTMERYTITAEEFKISESAVRKSISRMKERV